MADKRPGARPRLERAHSESPRPPPVTARSRCRAARPRLDHRSAHAQSAPAARAHRRSAARRTRAVDPQPRRDSADPRAPRRRPLPRSSPASAAGAPRSAPACSKSPSSYRDVADEHLLEVALIENIQREDLNPIEEAQAYRRLTDELQLSQEAIAAAVGKDRATIANYMRLLRLPAEVRNDLASGALSMGHARALVTLPDEAAQRRVAREVVSRGLSVRETEAIVRREGRPPAPPPPPPERSTPTRAPPKNDSSSRSAPRVRIVRKGTRRPDRDRLRQRRRTAAPVRDADGQLNEAMSASLPHYLATLSPS